MDSVGQLVRRKGLDPGTLGQKELSNGCGVSVS